MDHTDVEVWPTEDLIPYSNNPKEHPDEQVQKIASSIKNYGWDQPIVVDGDGEIIKGHGRRQAAQVLGLDEVPVIVRGDLTDAEARAARIADNRTAESDWIDEDLTLELEQLDEQGVDLELTGFDDDELDDLLNDLDESDPDGLDSEPLAEKDVKDIKILNLYAGIGGNRQLWGNADVTAVEHSEKIADAYQDFHPEDTVVVDDAHEYLLEHYNEFDFIWSSPPCPTHSKLKPAGVAASEQGNTGAFDYDSKAVYPDMDLYAEIILLQTYFDGKFCVENVKSYYDPLIEPIEAERHYLWTNFDIGASELEGYHDEFEAKATDADVKQHAEYYGFEYDSVPNMDDYPRDKVIRNCVHPEVGKAILDAAIESDTDE